MGWTKESIYDVKAAADLGALIGRDTKLVREGADLVGCCCLPGHKDDTPSLRVAHTKGLWRCRGCSRGGSAVDWIKAMRGCTFREAMLLLSESTAVPLVEEARAGALQTRKLVATYPYKNADGVDLYAIERFEPGKQGRSKDILQRQADGSYGKSPVQVLYRLPSVIAAVAAGEPIYVVEGEKAADALTALGVCATTHAGGASAGKVWERPGFNDALQGARVVLVPDNDDVGRKLMAHTSRSLLRVAKSTTVVTLPVEGEGDDIVEWIRDGGDLEGFLSLVRGAVLSARSGKKEWTSLLRHGQHGIKGSPGNAELVVRNDDDIRELFAFNRFKNHIEMTRKPPWDELDIGYPRPLSDIDVTRFTTWIERRYDFDVGPKVLGAVIASCADHESYDPLVGWLQRLRWDGVPRLSTWLTAYAGAVDNIYTRAVGRAWMISCVARAIVPGCQVDTTLILEGAQGKGKSSLLRALVGSEYFMDHLPDFASKDAAMLVAKAWVHELSELSSLNKNDVERIKQFLTQRSDAYRPPYGSNTIDVLRKCAFAASTNRFFEYLKDSTGNRRFWPVRTDRMDVAGIARDREQIWAEAVAAFKAKESWHIIDPAVLAFAVDEQADRVEQDIWVANIAKYVETQRTTTTADVLTQLGVEICKRTPRDGERVCSVLRGLGWTEARSRTTSGRIRVWSPPPPPEPEKLCGPCVDQSWTKGSPSPLVQDLSLPEAVSDAWTKGPEQTDAKHSQSVAQTVEQRSMDFTGTSTEIHSKPLVHSGPLVRGLPDAAKSGPKEPDLLRSTSGPTDRPVDLTGWEVGEF